MTEKSRFVILDRTRPGIHVDGAVDAPSIRTAFCGLNDIDDACFAHLASDPERLSAAVSRFMQTRSQGETFRVAACLEGVIARSENANLVHTDAEV